jgi:hypothetical protein
MEFQGHFCSDQIANKDMGVQLTGKAKLTLSRGLTAPEGNPGLWQTENQAFYRKGRKEGRKEG